MTASLALPSALVADVGFVAGRTWAVIEFSAAWGAGLNGCEAEKVFPAIMRASAGRNRPSLGAEHTNMPFRGRFPCLPSARCRADHLPPPSSTPPHALRPMQK